MASFDEHIVQFQKNVHFLEFISAADYSCCDWQVTVAFYSALHLVNAHLVNKMQQNYISHTDVDKAINPNNAMSVARLNEDVYTSYKSLYNLSRRSRYLVSEKASVRKEESADHTIAAVKVTHEKHVEKARKHLNSIITFFEKQYSITLTKAA